MAVKTALKEQITNRLVAAGRRVVIVAIFAMLGTDPAARGLEKIDNFADNTLQVVSAHSVFA